MSQSKFSGFFPNRLFQAHLASFWVLALLIASFVFSGSSYAARVRNTRDSQIVHFGGDGGKLGLGVVLGEPSGLTGKYWLNSRSAIDVGLAYDFSSFFLIYADYLYHFHGLFGRSSEFVSELTPYAGIGGVIFMQSSSTGVINRSYFQTSQGSVGIGMRVPFGIEWRPNATPFGIFVELVPGLGIIPATFGFFEAGIGGRFYF